MLQIYLCYFFQLVLIFGPFWVIFGPFWQFSVIFGPFFGANFLWQNIALCYLNHFLQLCLYGGNNFRFCVALLKLQVWWRRRSKSRYIVRYFHFTVSYFFLRGARNRGTSLISFIVYLHEIENML